jgi:hypothetical protein
VLAYDVRSKTFQLHAPNTTFEAVEFVTYVTLHRAMESLQTRHDGSKYSIEDQS